jgi:hypothetical protein
MRLVHKLAFTTLLLVTSGTVGAQPISMIHQRAKGPMYGSAGTM